MAMKSTAGDHGRPTKGRGASSNPEGRFEALSREPEDAWPPDPGDEPGRPKTVVTLERAKSIISRHDSPDLNFAQSINPYRGCEQGCPYCYARPSHAYLGLSPGLDFETRLFAKENASQLLAEELRRPGYRCEPIMLGANTDCYQPIERTHGITRSVLELLARCRHPAAIVTKSALVERDLDLLVPMAREGLVCVTISVTTLDNGLASKLEPRASAPRRRLEAIRRLAAAGVPVGVNVAPVIPFLTDSELESILEAAVKAGATHAGYTLLRLPWEVRQLFKEWLERHVPLKAEHVMSRVRDMRGGRENDPEFGSRMHGTGTLGRLLSQRFRKACARLGLDASRDRVLDAGKFVPPAPEGQGTLF